MCLMLDVQKVQRKKEFWKSSIEKSLSLARF